MSFFSAKKYLELLREAETASKVLAKASAQNKDKVLLELVQFIKTYRNELIRVNKREVKNAVSSGKNSAFINRLSITNKAIDDMLEGIKTVAASVDPVGKVIEKRKLRNGISLCKISAPLGTIGVIYESRPNVTIDAMALCLKSGNAVVLKGGSDALESNKFLVSLCHLALAKAGLPEACVTFLDTSDRNVVKWLVRQHRFLQLVIPRGGYQLVKTVVGLATVPVLSHSAGGARIYIDESADADMAIKICTNAKVNRPGTCNSVDTILIHKNIAKNLLPPLANALREKRVEVVGDDISCSLVDIKRALNSDWDEEFLRLKVAIKVVKNISQAIEFIMLHSKCHSEGIVATKKAAIKTFVDNIDSAGIFVNCSTRLHDGGVFGMGAEMGIATGKLHARGPVGLKELTSYKWVAYGNGQIRN